MLAAWEQTQVLLSCLGCSHGSSPEVAQQEVTRLQVTPALSRVVGKVAVLQQGATWARDTAAKKNRRGCRRQYLLLVHAQPNPASCCQAWWHPRGTLPTSALGPPQQLVRVSRQVCGSGPCEKRGLLQLPGTGSWVFAVSSLRNCSEKADWTVISYRPYPKVTQKK